MTELSENPSLLPKPEQFYGTTHTDAVNNFVLRHGGVEIAPNRSEWIKAQYDSAFEYAKEHNHDKNGIYVELHKTQTGEYIPVVAIDDMDYYGNGSFGTVSEYSGHNLAQIYHDEETSDDMRFASNRPKLVQAGFYGLISETGIGEYRAIDPPPPPIVRGRLREVDGKKVVSIMRAWLTERGEQGMNTGEFVYAFSHLDTGVELIEADKSVTTVRYEQSSEIMNIAHRTDFVSIPKERRSGDVGKPLMALGAVTSTLRTKNNFEEKVINIKEGIGLKFNWLEGYARKHSDLYEAAGIDQDMFLVKIGSDTMKVGGFLDYLDDKHDTPRMLVRIECDSSTLNSLASDIDRIRDTINEYLDDLYGRDVSVSLLHRVDEDHAFKQLDLASQSKA